MYHQGTHRARASRHRHGRPLSLHTPRLQPHARALLCSAPRAARFCTREHRERGGSGGLTGGSQTNFASQVGRRSGGANPSVPSLLSLTLEVCTLPVAASCPAARGPTRVSHCSCARGVCVSRGVLGRLSTPRSSSSSSLRPPCMSGTGEAGGSDS